MKTNRNLSATVFYFLVFYGCHGEDTSNDIPMSIPIDDDDNDMRLEYGSGGGENRDTEDGRSENPDLYNDYHDDSDDFILNENGESSEYGVDNYGNLDASDGGHGMEGKDLLRTSLLVATIGIFLVVSALILVVTTTLIYFVQKRRASHNLKRLQLKRKKHNVNDGRTCGVPTNTEYESLGPHRSKQTVLELSYYETPMAPPNSNFEYDYPLNTVRSRCTKTEEYLNV